MLSSIKGSVGSLLPRPDPGGEGGAVEQELPGPSLPTLNKNWPAPANTQHTTTLHHHYPQTGKNSDKNTNNLQEQVPCPRPRVSNDIKD